MSGVSRYDRVSGGTRFSGEVRPRAGSPGVYEADYATYSQIGALLETGAFVFQIPTADLDANGLPDVVQIDKNGSIALGGSGLSDGGTPFSASGSLSRAAGSSTGTYRVNVVSATGVTSVTYTGSIRIVGFTGTISYQRGVTNSITLNMRYTLDPATTVTATTTFTVVNSDRIDIPQFAAMTSSGTFGVFRAGSLTRQGNTYRGDFQAVDGNPATSWADYLSFRVASASVRGAKESSRPTVAGDKIDSGAAAGCVGAGRRYAGRPGGSWSSSAGFFDGGG